jgi:diguanylate cyclase (GGDEF)-like protein/PAS domain S-box-containing protein
MRFAPTPDQLLREAARDEPAPPEPERARSSALLLVAAVVVVLLSGGWIAQMHLRAHAANLRANHIVQADRSLHEMEILRLRGRAGDLGISEAAVQDDASWARVRRELDAAGMDALVARVDRLTPELHLDLGRPREAGPDPVLDTLELAEHSVDGEAARLDHSWTVDSARAWRLTGLTLALAFAIVGLLVAAWLRAHRAARRLAEASARAAGERGALRNAARRFRALVQHASEGVLVIDADGAVAYATPSLERLLGRPEHELEGRGFARLVAPEDAGRVEEMIATARRSGAPTGGELVLVHAGGHPVHVDVRVADRLGDPDVGGVVLTVRDVSERRRLERKLRQSARRDRLTGLPNRATFEDWLRDALAADEGLAVVLLDLDDFETVNDSLGHLAGDRLLMACADRLREAAGEDARIARIGSDDFGVLLAGAREPEHAERAARDLAGALSAPVRLDEAEVPVTVSAGMATAEPGMSAEDLLRCADSALHIAQARGHGELETYSPAMHADARRRLKLRGALARAVEEGGLDLAYQPIVDLARDEATAVEALLRWQLPDGTPVAPADFIPVAEAAGLIVGIGAWVLERACADVVGRRTESGAQLRVCVNVSAIQLRTAGFAAQVAAALERSGLPPEALTLELTESVMVDDVGAVIEALQLVRRLGVKVAIDDFGTGFSSLASLADLPVDELKLDRAFVAAMDGGDAHEALVGGVVSLAERMGLPLIAEGVETPAQLAALRRLGCGWAQGFHLGRPGPLDAVALGLGALRRR